jgi:hypothetical protein
VFQKNRCDTHPHVGIWTTTMPLDDSPYLSGARIDEFSNDY